MVTGGLFFFGSVELWDEVLDGRFGVCGFGGMWGVGR